MKKFLSLVLALVMTMSLVTIGAGATEYKDLTDKSEIQYEEAVAVLNKLGIITGYENGSFKPTGALTRGAAAKIIVSLMIGSEAASNLTVAAAPYKDVATTNTFAAVISYCKTAGYINGYSDGTFRPTASLTGYAFAKMLLGALGYDGVQEGFTGSGWTMNVAKLGNTAGLFNDFATAFKGNDGVTREGACLLALNALKGTEVQYSGGTNITTTTGNATTNVVTKQERSYKTSNNSKINQNIGKNKDNLSAEYTLEFGEEHFTDLKLTTTASTTDDFQRPSNSWSYKNVNIGTYAKTADFTFTTAASGDTNVDKLKDMGLNGLNVNSNTTLAINGVASNPFSGTVNTPDKLNTAANSNKLFSNGGKNYSANGTVIEVYLNSATADLIDSIVIIETQLMKVNSVSSASVSLKKVESMGNPVAAVKDDNNCFKALSALKADDYVLITAYKDGDSYTVASVTVPQVVTGKISAVALKKDATTVNGVTVAGTAYKMSALWSSEDGDLNKNSVSTTIDSTVYMDTYGFAIYVKNVKAASETIIYDETFDSLVNGKIVHYAQGYSLSGEKLSLNFGTLAPASLGMVAGRAYSYVSTTDNSAEFKLDAQAKVVNGATNSAPGIVASASSFAGKTFNSDVKFIYLAAANNTVYGAGNYDLDSISVKTGVQAVKNTDCTVLNYVLDNDGYIKAVIVTNDIGLEISTDVLYVSKVTGSTTDSSNNPVSIFTAYIKGVETTGCVATKVVDKDAFYTYSVDTNTNVYTLHSYINTTRNTSVQSNISLVRNDIINKAYVSAFGTLPNLSLSGATVIDLSGDGYSLTSVKDMAEETKINTYTVSLVYNGNSSSDSYGQVAYVFINDTASTAYTFNATTFTSAATAYYDKACTEAVVDGAAIYAGQTLYAKAAVALSTITMTGVTNLAVATAPTAASGNSSFAVYSFRVNGTPAAAAGVTNWVAVSNVAAVAAAAPKGAYSATVDKTIAEYGSTVTVTVQCTTAPTAGTDTVTLTGVTGGSAATGVTFTATGSKTITFEAGAASFAAVMSVSNV